MYGKAAPAFSMAARRESTHKTDSPGPGVYNAAKEFYKEVTRFSFSKLPRAAGVSPGSLGPGQYDAHKPFYADASTRSFSKAPRMAVPRSSVPGPGTYSLKSSVGTGLAPVFLKRLESVFKKEAPGPGAYDPVLRSNVRQFSLGRKPTYEPRSISPGPGAYDTSVRDLAGPLKLNSSTLQTSRISEPSLGSRFARLNGFGKAPRDSFKPSKLPGPGSYDPKLSPGRSVRLYPRLTTPFKNTNPGPGQYDIPSSIGRQELNSLSRK